MVENISPRSYVAKWFADFEFTDKVTGNSLQFSTGTQVLSFMQAFLQVNTDLGLHYLNKVGTIPGNYMVTHFSMWATEENDDHPLNPGN